AAVQDATAPVGAPGSAPAFGVRQSSGAFERTLTRFLPSLAEVPRKELEALMESMSEAGKVETVEFSKNGNGTLLPANG
ncbi:MAG: hypothetical protein AAB316_07500, partial [Bacteroidota bacterium]